MANRYELQGKVCLVTGAARGIGNAVARLLRNHGAQVHAWDCLPVRIDGVVADLVDITQPDDIARALERPGAVRPNVLVNDAGYLGGTHAFLEHAADDWRRIVAVNLVGTMTVTQAVVPHIVAAGGGHVVNFGSLAGKEGLPGIAAYSAASGGVIAFTKALARELADHGVFVNCIAPGPIDTDMIRDLGEDVVARMIDDSPMKRLGTAGEVAQLVAWLVSDASRFNTGAVFDMSGGRARY
jgi:3-oxoacyl-[acyl-carrier protein] reductase